MTRSIGLFARAALERANKKLSETPDSYFTDFSVAGVGVRFIETAPRIGVWINGQFDPAIAGRQASILCDYSGWLPPLAPRPMDLQLISPLEMDDILAKQGLAGNYDTASGMWDLFDPSMAIGIRLQTTPDDHPIWESTAPFANFLAWILRRNGKHILHAATVGIDGVGVLLVGAGGSGKSGTTLAAVAAGLTSVGDDYCAVTLGDQVIAQPVFRSMKQDAKGMARVGCAHISEGMTLNWQDKFVFDLRDHFPNSAVDALEIKAVLLPHIAGITESVFQDASGFEALQALAPSTMKQLSGDRESVFKACSELARRVPSFHLSLSENPREISASIAEFIQKELS